EVILKEKRKRLFTALFSKGKVVVKGRAVATFEDSGSACILALHHSATKAALFSGSSIAKFINCSVMSDSIAGNSITVQGTGKLEASCLYAVGGIDAGKGVTMTGCDAAKPGVPPVLDPFADLVAPSTSGSCKNDNGATLHPGVYCSGMTLKGNKTLDP